MLIIRNSYLPGKRYAAINLFGVLFCRHNTRVTPVMINHERIHTAQMLEMGILPFYIWYLVEWLVKVPTPGRAYLRISFEREAYQHEHDLDYLSHRRLYAWWPLQWNRKGRHRKKRKKSNNDK